MWGLGKSKRKKEIELERERYPSFQKRDAHALRFGSRNPISGIEAMTALGKGAKPRLPVGSWAKVII